MLSVRTGLRQQMERVILSARQGCGRSAADFASAGAKFTQARASPGAFHGLGVQLSATIW
eukprot:11172168-Lingulodinium_polyedra.AAC.1